jgi:hypothetical protein
LPFHFNFRITSRFHQHHRKTLSHFFSALVSLAKDSAPNETKTPSTPPFEFEKQSFQLHCQEGPSNERQTIQRTPDHPKNASITRSEAQKMGVAVLALDQSHVLY